jgi:seryl-tRNA synthetase
MEAGRGVSSKGLYRLHQFSKVEMFAFCSQQQSEKIHQEMLDIQIELLEDLGLSYRVLDMPTLELGASAYRKYDIEVWTPSRQEWGEVTSTSNCTDYQSIRLNSFYRSGSEKLHQHTVNGTACAVPRIIMNLLEYGWEDGKVKLPKCLENHLNFNEIPCDKFKWKR